MQYRASKVNAIQIIIVDCDSFVIQPTMNNLWRKNQNCWKTKSISMISRRPKRSHSGCHLRLWLICHSVYDDNLWQTTLPNSSIIQSKQGNSHSDYNRRLWLFCHSVYDEQSVAEELRKGRKTNSMAISRRLRRSHSGCHHRLWLICHSVYDDNLWQTSW